MFCCLGLTIATNLEKVETSANEDLPISHEASCRVLVVAQMYAYCFVLKFRGMHRFRRAAHKSCHSEICSVSRLEVKFEVIGFFSNGCSERALKLPHSFKSPVLSRHFH